MSTKWRGLLCLFIVYIVWGGTYLAIRVAVREGSGFPPFYMAGSRVLLGGIILLLIAALMKYPLHLSRSSWVVLMVSTLLLWNGGNGLVTWSQQRAASGYAALVVGTTPLWGALLDALIRRKRPSISLVLSLLIGFVGLIILTGPTVIKGERGDLLATLALLIAPLSWALGSAYQQRRPLPQAIVVVSGYQQIMASVVFLSWAWMLNEPVPAPTPEAWWAWGYLLVFGSIIAYTAYVVALRSLSLPVVMTYAYVNPVIAVLLGWWLLDEPVGVSTLAGMALILAAVGGVFHDRFR